MALASFVFGTRLQRYEEAIAEWKGLIDREPETAGLYVLLAEVYLKTGQYGEAIAACKDAIRLKPEHPQAHYDLGEAYLRKGDIDPAVREYVLLRVLDEQSAKRLRLDVKYALATMITNNEGQADLHWIAQKRQRVLDDSESQRALAKAQMQAIQTMVDEGTISAAEGKLKQYDVVIQHRKMGDEAVRQNEHDLQAFVVERKARPGGWELAELEMEKVDECIRQGLPSPSFQPITETDSRLPGSSTLKIGGIAMLPDGRFFISAEAGPAYEGDTIKGYRVRKIHADSVEFEKDGKTWVQKVE